VLAGLAVLVLAAAAAGTAYLLRAGTHPATSPEPVGRSATNSAAAGAPPSAQARDRLAAVVAADRAAAEALVGRWVPQVASKQVGTVDAGMAYDEAAIVAEVEALKRRFPEAVVVRSDDFASFRRPGFWVTLVAVPSPSADGANAWCADNGFAPGQCFAKRLSHGSGPQGNTVPR
jgi:serine/threonine-protein kinase